jgi:multidrug efflux pump subunit AcrB
LTKFIGSEFIPEEDSGDLNIVAYMPIGTRVEEADKVARQMEDIFAVLTEKKFSYVRCGQVPGIGRAMGQDSGSHIIYGGCNWCLRPSARNR